MLFLKNQSGVSIIAAIFIIVILAFMGMVFLTLLTTTQTTTINELQSTRALYVAEGGMERGIRYFTSPTLTERIACASIPSTNTALGSGEFSLTIEAGSPFYSSAATTLSFAIGAADATINVGTTAGYAAFGRIMIDRELIDYTGTTANSFTGVLRGRDGTTAVSHANATRVGQDQCTVSSTGGVPDLTTYTGRRQVREGIQIQEGWIVGNIGGSATNENINSVYCTAANNCWAVADNGVIVRWDGASWSLDAYTASDNLFSIHCPNANNCWAVGDRTVGILYWNGAWSTSAPNGSPPNLQQDMYSIFMISTTSGWTVGNTGDGYRFTGSWAGSDPSNRDLMSVHCPAVGNCWAVGDNNNGIYYWNGATWSNAINTGLISTANDLNSVFMLSTTSGWAVGNNGRVYRYSGAPSWSNTGTITGEDLNEVHCPDANNCWTVGTNGVIFRWTSAGGWQSQTSNTTEDLNSVYCVTSIDCWAVGDNGTVLHWDGANWSSNVAPVVLRWNGAAWGNSSALLSAGANQNLNSVSMLSYADCWVVGDTGGGGVAPCTNNRARIANWNGSSWPCNATSPSNRNLNSVSLVSANYGWAVGAGGSIVYWNGITLAEQNPAPNIITARELDSVHAIATNEVWITGVNETQNGRTCLNGDANILRYTGAWSCQNAGAPNQRFRSIFMFPDGTDIGAVPDDGWIVGNSSGGNFRIYRWNSPVANQWNNQSVNSSWNATLNSVYMLDTDGDGLGDDGWAVGNRSGFFMGSRRITLLRWNHGCSGVGGAATGVWAVCSFDPGAAFRQNLNSVFCVNASDCWAVGNLGLILHWDGTSWTVHSQSGGQVGGVTTANLNEIYIIGPKQRPQAMWREVFQ